MTVRIKGYELQAKQAIWLLIAVIVIVLDQWTKSLVSSALAYGQRINVLPFLDITYVHNPGAAFSFLANAGGWQIIFFTAIAVVMSIVLLVWTLVLPRTAKWMPVTLTLIMGGAIGNAIDRVRFGYVEDFILAYWQNWYFPAFNVADAAISVGAVMLLVDAFWLDKRRSAV
ncbi:signal peptidase II [Salinispirillum sp. LH 10-3-1]|uniref:Lipoprotein signal peptidase n=1 Tax=Salinispirillum sp. LH 10-3-1 TaxID=2952525 RepID=A0AB38YHF9_9GAMM